MHTRREIHCNGYVVLTNTHILRNDKVNVNCVYCRITDLLKLNKPNMTLGLHNIIIRCTTFSLMIIEYHHCYVHATIKLIPLCWQQRRKKNKKPSEKVNKFIHLNFCAKLLTRSFI